MSTKIYDAYILDKSNINELMLLKNHLSQTVHLRQKEVICKKIMFLFCKALDTRAMDLPLHPSSSRILDPSDNYISNLYKLLEEDKNHIFCELIFIPYNKRSTILKFFTNDHILQEKWSNQFTDFHYQNQVDKPDEISSKEWNKRMKFWESKDGTFKDLGLSCTLSKDIRTILNEIYLKDKDYLIENQPSIDYRIEEIIRYLMEQQYNKYIQELEIEFDYTKFRKYEKENYTNFKNEHYSDIKNKLLPKINLTDLFLPWQLK